MSHFALLWKARTIEKYRQNYENEKLNSIIKSNADIPEKTLHQRWKHYSHDLHKRLSRTFSQWAPEGSTISKFFINLRAEMRFSKILLRSLFGFVGGLVLTYLCFVFLVFQLSLSLVNATVISSLFGMLITLGLTFNNRMRCLVFLLIPQLFSRAGRYTLTCYALVLILTGPATNIFKNSEVLSESMACSQEHIKTTVRDINESVKKPYNFMKDYIKLMVEASKRITSSLRSSILAVNRLALSVASIIQSSFSWLTSMGTSCHKRLGTPYDRCIATINRGIVEKLPEDDWYTVASMGKIACGMLKGYRTFCVASEYAEETFFATIKRKLKTFTARLSKSMYFVITAQHSYSIVGNSSSSQVAAGIVTEIRKRADPILTWLSWSSCVTSLFLMLILFRAHHYQHMFETRSRFDNRYITREFRELDLLRLRESRETVLPLSTRERAKYVTTTSFRLVASEKTYMNRSAVFMVITTFKLLIHMVADYSLYWLLTTIRHHGSLETVLESGSSTTGAYISGKGFVSRLLQSLINTINIPLMPYSSTSKNCLPNPRVPDFKRYSQIGTLICAQWFFALFEPYGLRLRHLIVGHYNPDRAKARAAWLYNHILRNRGSFMKFARRKLHREYKYYSKKNLAVRQRFRYLVPFKWLRYLLGIQLEEDHCLLCNAFEDVHDLYSDLIRCEVPDCPGIYCKSCFSDIGKMCTICLSPVDYGDLSDVSLETGSSNEDSDKDDDYYTGANSYNNNEENTDMDNDNTQSQFYNDESVDNNSDDSSSSKYSYEILPLLHHQGDVGYDNDHRKDATNKNTNKTCLKINNPGFDNIEVQCIKILKQITIDVYVENFSMLNPYVLYGFYEIRMQNSSLCIHKDSSSNSILGNIKKRTRKKNSTNTLRHLLVTCKNKNGEEPQKVKNSCGKGDEGDGKKDNRGNTNRKRMSLDKINKIIKGNGTKRPKSKNNKQATGSSTNNNSTSRIVSKWSRYWKNISSVLSCTKVMSPTKLQDNEESKHKRKKKRKEMRIRKIRASNEATRQYRIFTYFSDQDWRRNKLIKKFKNSFESQTKITEKDEVEVNFIKVPKLNLTSLSNEESYGNYGSQSLINKEEKLIMHANVLDNTYPGIKRDNTTTTLQTIFRGLNMSTGQNTPIKSLTEELCDAKCVDDDDLDISLPRSMRFFRSLDNVFEQLEHQDRYPKVLRPCTGRNVPFASDHDKLSILKSSGDHNNSPEPKNDGILIKKTVQKSKSKAKQLQENVDVPAEAADKSSLVRTKNLRENVSVTNVFSNKETQVKVKKKSGTSLIQNFSKRNTKGLPCSCGCKCPLSLLRDLYSSLFHCQRTCHNDGWEEEDEGEIKERVFRQGRQIHEKEIERGINVKIKPNQKEERRPNKTYKTVREIEKKEVTEVKISPRSPPTIEEVREVKKIKEVKQNKIEKAKVIEKISDQNKIEKAKVIEKISDHKVVEDIKEEHVEPPPPPKPPITPPPKPPITPPPFVGPVCPRPCIPCPPPPCPPPSCAPPPCPPPACPPPPCPPPPCPPPPCTPPPCPPSVCPPPHCNTVCPPLPCKSFCPSPDRERLCRARVSCKRTNNNSKKRECCTCPAPPLPTPLVPHCKCLADARTSSGCCKCPVPTVKATATATQVTCKCSDVKSSTSAAVTVTCKCTPTPAKSAKTQTPPCKCVEATLKGLAPPSSCKCTDKTSSKTICKCTDKTSSKTICKCTEVKSSSKTICKCSEPVKEKKKKKSKGAATENLVDCACQAPEFPDPCQQKPVTYLPLCQPKHACKPKPCHYRPVHCQDECLHQSLQRWAEAVNRSDCRKHSRPRNVMVCDAEVNAYNKQTCTCATQHVVERRDFGTYDNFSRQTAYLQEGTPIELQRSISFDKQGTTSYDQHDLTTTSSTTGSTEETATFSQDTDGSETELTGRTDETKTDTTTTLTVLPMDYRHKRTRIDLDEKPKVRVAVITKANQSTTTEKTIYCDAGTVTQDWWSPILEKKVNRKDYMNEGHQIKILKKDKRLLKDIGITAEGRIVTFKSRTQIIPRESFRIVEDILSPSRYLLESQKYYNELFNSKFYSPHVFPVTLKHQMLEPRSPVNSRQGRRSRISKRREDGYPCKKQPTPRRRFR